MSVNFSSYISSVFSIYLSSLTMYFNLTIWIKSDIINIVFREGESASFSDGIHRVSYDKVITVMKQTGHDLPSLYKETSEGGLATTLRVDELTS